ncbi:MAG: LTA synthase family protein [Gemmatimonadota bacterium]
MRRWRDPLAIAALYLVAYSVGRILLLAIHWPTFSELSGPRLARGLVHGLRFDLSMTLLLAGLPLWLMAMPARWARREEWQAPWRWLCYCLLVASLFLIAADLLYFSTVGRHVGSELALALGSDAAALARMPLDHPLALGAFTLVAIGLASLWLRLGRRRDSAEAGGGGAPMRWTAWAVWIAAAPLVVIGIRGGLQEKPINIVNAFEHGSVAEGHLTLNAPFSAYHSTRNTRSSAGIDAMPAKEAVRVVRSGLDLPGRRWTSERYPLERANASERGNAPTPVAVRGTNRPNVVVLVLESWDALLTDAIRTREGLPALGLTPEFDSLARDGLLLTRFYAAGQRSIEGIGALIAGVPTLPGMPYMGRGMEQSRLGFLGELARRNGYRTLFVRSAKRGSYRLDAIARLAGFEDYAGAEDVLGRPSHTSVESGYWGAWDFDSLRLLHDRIIDGAGSGRGAQPFLAFFFGSSTHVPYPLPGERWEVLPPDTPEARFRNTVHYVDWALGRFVETAREAGYYDDTLFLVVADQTSSFAPADPLPDRHWIPALLIGPGIPADTVDSRVASHLDVLPTIVDYLGWTDPYAALGESVLGERRPGALLKQGELMLRLGTDGWVAHDLARRLGGAGRESVRDSLERMLLAEAQLVMELLRTNRVYSGG